MGFLRYIYELQINLNKLVLVILSSFLLVVGCTKNKAKQIQEHVADVKIQNESDPKTDPETQSEITQLKTEIDRLSQGQKLLDEVNVRKIFKSILNVEYIKSSKFMNSEIEILKLNLLNRILLHADYENDFFQERKDYARLVLEQCLIPKRACVNIKYFSQDNLSSFTLVKLALGEKDLRTYYSMLRLAFEIKKEGSLANSLKQAYLARSAEFEIWLLQQKYTRDLSDHQNIMGALTLADSRQQSDKTSDNKWLAQYDFWNFKDKRQSNSSFGSDERSVMSILAKSYLYVDSSKSKYHPEFVKYLNELRTSGSTALKLRKLLDQNKNLLKDFSINELNLNSDVDEYFYMISLLMSGKFSVSEMQIVFENSKMELNKLLDRANQIIFIEYMSLVMDINNNMYLELFSGKNKILIKNIVDEAISNSETNKVFVWQFREKSERIKQFLNMVIAKEEVRVNSEVFKFLNNMDMNIKLTAVYPQMLAIAYQLVRHDFKKEYSLNFGALIIKWTVDSKTILSEIMSGAASSWFSYVSDPSPLGSNLMALSSLEFFIKARLYNVYKVNLAGFLDKIISGTRKGRATQMLNGIYTKVHKIESSNAYDSLIRACEGLQKGDLSISHKMFEIVGNQSLGIPKEINDLPGHWMTANNISSVDEFANTELAKAKVMALWGNAGSIFLEDMRNENLQYMKMLTYLHGILKPLKNLPSTDTGASSFEFVEKQIENDKKEFKSKLEKIFSYSRTFEQCYFQLMKNNRQIVLGIMKYEMQFLREMHKQLNLAGSNTTALENIRNEISKMLPVGLKSHEIISNQKFHYTFTGFLYRLRTYLKQGLKFGNLNLPALAKNVDVFPPDAAQANLYSIFNGSVFVDLNSSFDEVYFVKSAAQLITNSMGWEEGSASLGLYDIVLSKQAGIRFSELLEYRNLFYILSDIQGENGVKEDEALANLVATPLEIEKYFVLQKEDTKAFEFFTGRNLGRDSWLDRRSVYSSFYNKGERALPAPPYDFILSGFAEPLLGPYRPFSAEDDTTIESGAVWSAPMYQPKSWVKQSIEYYNVWKRGNQFAFGIGKTAREYYFSIYKGLISDFTQKRIKLVKEIEKRYKEDMENNKPIKLEFYSGYLYSGPYVSPKVLGDSEKFIETLHESTNSLFR